MSSFGIPSPRCDFLDANGKISREWNMFLQNVFTRIGGSTGDSTEALKLLINQLILENIYRQIDASFPSIPAPVVDVQEPHDLTARIAELAKRVEEDRIELSMLPNASAALAEANKVISTKAALAMEAWNAPTLLNGWVIYDGLHNPPGYCKDQFGRVYLRGLVKSGTIGLDIFTLPIGYRPAAIEIFPAISNSAFGGGTITPAGAVNPGVGSNVYFCLDGITFRVP